MKLTIQDIEICIFAISEWRDLIKKQNPKSHPFYGAEQFDTDTRETSTKLWKMKRKLA